RIKSFPWFDRGRYTSGLIIEHSIDRMLPFGGLAQRTIGYTRQTGDTSQGIVGLEHYFNTELEGEKGLVFRKVVSQQTTLPHIERDDVEPDPGLDIHTTLDIDLQDFADATLRKSLEEYDAKNGCVVLMEVKTGNVLTMVNLERNGEGEYVEHYNHAVGTLFEPGSTMKIPVMAALLEHGMPLDKLVSMHNGEFRVAGIKVPISSRPKKDYYDAYDIIKYSSNIGIVQMVDELFPNNASFRDALFEQFPYEKTGITIHGEEGLQIPAVESWGIIDKAWKSFGYGLRLTALHILTHYNAIANNGIAVQPRLVSHTSKLGQTVKTFPTIELGKLMSPETAQNLTSMMKLVVNDSRGTAHNALSSRNVSICGKTGTTMIKDGDYAYEDDIKRALFCGFFPVEKPQYSMIVVLSYIDAKEHDGIGGGSTAAPVFGDIAEFAYARIGEQSQMPSALLASDGVTMSSMLTEDWKILSNLLNIDSEQPLYAISQVDLDESNDNATVSTDDQYRTEENRIPYLMGMGLSDAVSLCLRYGYTVSCEGYGYVATQWPEAGSVVDKNSKIHLVLQ
ncbi:MAG: penicillin-binding transpeptidase domain-containing protein, partial [Bacteroidota bacterium]|nr:penicillin-binding transpeptidase domain-containing protein [Bacteroidota bacterium]